MDQGELKQIIFTRIDELPTLPVVIPKLIKLLNNDRASASDVTQVISSDMALTSKILKIANSAYYGFSGEITNMDHAVALLGFNTVKSLALSISVIKRLPAGGDDSRFSQEGLWIHSLAVAMCLEKLAKRLKLKLKADYLFVVGLLHDIGKVILLHYFYDKFQVVLESVNSDTDIDYLDTEHEIFGTDHGEIGAFLLERWRFPEQISIPIAMHHRRELPEGTDYTDIALLRTANVLSKQVNLGGSGIPATAILSKKDLEFLGLDQVDLGNVKKELQSAGDEIVAFSTAIS